MSSLLVTEKVVEDRIYHLIKLVKEEPLHEARSYFEKKYHIPITMETWIKIYKTWHDQRTFSPRHILQTLRKQEWWGIVEYNISERVNKDLADFIYENWKKAQKNDPL